MIVFKTFLKILNKCKTPIILYTVFLIVFGALNFQTNDSSTNFVASKPDILIINKDENKGITKNLISYMKKNNNIKKIDNNTEAIDDALFYRDINYIIYIPNNYREDFLSGKTPKVKIKSTGDYQSSYAEMLLNKYINTATIYQKKGYNEEQIVNNINDTLSKQSKIKITSKIDSNSLSKITFYYNFLNYSLLAGCVYVICIVLSSFKARPIKKRTIISSMDYKKFNRQLLLSNSLFALVLWIFYVFVSYILLGTTLLSTNGLLYILNSFIFTICVLTIAFLIGTLVSNKNAINGIINVVALGSSFLCGAFVPMEWLPDSVLKVAHILPSYWYIQNNEMLKNLEKINMTTLRPYFTNIIIILIFTIGFIIITNIISKKKLKEN